MTGRQCVGPGETWPASTAGRHRAEEGKRARGESGYSHGNAQPWSHVGSSRDG